MRLESHEYEGRVVGGDDTEIENIGLHRTLWFIANILVLLSDMKKYGMVFRRYDRIAMAPVLKIKWRVTSNLGDLLEDHYTNPGDRWCGLDHDSEGVF